MKPGNRRVNAKVLIPAEKSLEMRGVALFESLPLLLEVAIFC